MQQISERLYQGHQSEITSKQVFFSAIEKLQRDICVVDSISLTKHLIDQHTNERTAFFVNAVEVLYFDRDEILPWIKSTLFGKFDVKQNRKLFTKCITEINYNDFAGAIQTWNHMGTKIALYLHNVDHTILQENLIAINLFLSGFSDGTEVLDSLGDIISFLLRKLEKGKF